MKNLLREVITYALSLFISSLFVSGITIKYELVSILIAGVFLTVAFNIIKPLVSIIGAPLKIVTLGFFSFLTTAISLYIITLLYQGIKIVPFNFNGITILGIVIPSFHAGLILSYIIVSATIYLTSKAIDWLYDKK